LIGTVLIPLKVEARLFSYILGDQAYASTASGVLGGGVAPDDSNSQNIALLEANVTSASVFRSKNGKDKEEEVTGISSDASVFVSDNALVPAVGLMAGSPATHASGTGSGDFSFDEISFYEVRKGDTVAQVAELFDVSEDTILSANDMKKGDKLKEGDILLILPFSGIEHTVVKGDTPQGIANRYKVSLNDILIHNDLDQDVTLSIGDKLMIPGASLPNDTKENKPKTGTGTPKGKGGGSFSMPSVAGYFKNPVSGGRKSRGVTSSHKGVDIAAPIGTPIYASASGKVLTAKMGWNGAFGNMVILQHANGTKTLYAHMSKLGTTTGSQVSQGEVIGYVGNTGRSTGPHLHFEVLGAKNPF
jgi:murein DD-endopeptidase MepM/ murein hydrolase activator NlpD